jgi:SAM-dependent methyltransferase
MADLSKFADAAFDLIFHPCSNSFVPRLEPVWREASRVLRPGGRLLSGFCQPVLYLVDEKADERGEIVVRYRIPYSDLSQLTPAELQAKTEFGKTLDFGHSLEDQIGGQILAGLVIAGFYEDSWAPGVSAISDRISCFAATLAIKPPAALLRKAKK